MPRLFNLTLIAIQVLINRLQKALIESDLLDHLNKIKELRQAVAAGKQTDFLIGMIHMLTVISRET